MANKEYINYAPRDSFRVLNMDTLFGYITDGNKQGVISTFDTFDKSNPDMINRTNTIGETPLMHALRYGHSDIVDYLVNTKNADLTLQNPNNGKTALDYENAWNTTSSRNNIYNANKIYIVRDTIISIMNDVFGEGSSRSSMSDVSSLTQGGAIKKNKKYSTTRKTKSTTRKTKSRKTKSRSIISNKNKNSKKRAKLNMNKMSRKSKRSPSKK